MTRSKRASASSSNPRRVTGKGAALSSGAVGPNDDRLSAASRTPPAAAARATVNEPTVVSAAPAPSASVTVRVVVEIVTALTVAPEGAPARVTGAVPAV